MVPQGYAVALRVRARGVQYSLGRCTSITACAFEACRAIRPGQGSMMHVHARWGRFCNSCLLSARVWHTCWCRCADAHAHHASIDIECYSPHPYPRTHILTRARKRTDTQGLSHGSRTHSCFITSRKNVSLVRPRVLAYAHTHKTPRSVFAQRILRVRTCTST